MTSRSLACHVDFLTFPQQGSGLRRVYVALLCLSYLVTNTGMVFSLETKSGCHCAEELKSSSRCCCFNKSRSAGKTSGSSCCASRKSAGGNCCSARKQSSPRAQQSKSDSPQISRICGCGDSQHKGCYVTDPRQLNTIPRIISGLKRPQSLVMADDSFTSIALQPEIPPPRYRTR